jgi:hypothetical protein
MCIPKGPKYFAWFTYIDNKPVCIFLNIDNNEIQKIYHYYVAFKEELSLGTILYGTMYDKKFVCENLFYLKGTEINCPFIEKLEMIKDTLNSIHCSDYLGSISFFIPKIIKKNVLVECTNLSYNVYGLLTVNNNPKIFILNQHLFPFMIKKREDYEDVYELYAYNDKNVLTFYSTALVNDYKTSHNLKKIFYKNLITYKNVEFSDNEEEEENLGDFYVECIFIPEFKKWKPYVFKGTKATVIRNLENYEKKIFG